MSLHIAQVVTGLLPIPPNGWGAIERLIWEYKQEFERRGHRVELVRQEDISKGEYDVVHVHVADYALALAKRGIEYVFTMDDHHVVELGRESECYKRNYEALDKAKRGVVSAEFLVDYFGLPHVSYVPLGVDSEFYTPGSIPEEVRLLCVGNNGLAGTLFDRKGFRFAIEAARELDLSIHIAGPRNCNEQFFAENPDLLEGKVEVHYDLNDVELVKLFQSSTMLIHATSIEAGHPPLTVLEAMACGLPVVGTYVGNGVVSKDGEIERKVSDVVRGIGRVLSRYGYHRTKARETALGYSWSNSCDKLLKEVYQIRPKVKLVHLLTNKDSREPESIEVLSRVGDFGIEYVQHFEKIYSELPPKENCLRPDDVAEKPGWYKLAPNHYGNFKAFQTGVLDEFDEEVNFLILCEGDTKLKVSVEEFVSKVFECCELVDEFGVSYFSFGPRFSLDTGELVSGILDEVSDKIYVTNKIVGTHCIMFPQKIREFLRHSFMYSPWDASDLFLNSVFCPSRYKLGIVKECLVTQVAGLSLVDQKYKNFNQVSETSSIDKLVELYSNTKIKSTECRPTKATFSCSFIGGAKLEISDYMNREYEVEFWDKSNNTLVYSTTISSGNWAAPNNQWFINWEVVVKHKGEEVFSHNLDLKDRRVLVTLESRALGDTLAWFPTVERFRQKHKCELIAVTFHNGLFKETYPEITFAEPGEVVNNLYAMYTIGCFDEQTNRNKFNWKSIGLIKIAEDMLGLDHEEVRARLIVPKYDNPINEPYVCISEHSSMGCKYWHCPDAWPKVVEWLTKLGYKVIAIGSEGSNIPGVEVRPGKDIGQTLGLLKNAKAFFGVSSAPAWLAWTVGIPVVLISGCSFKTTEFTTNVVRILNEDVCHGCFNDPSLPLDRGNWNWCPRNKNFECTRSITPEMVIERASRLFE